MTKEKGLDRLYVEERVVELFRELTYQATKNASVYSQPFKTLKDAFFWAMSLGIHAGRREPLSGTRNGMVLLTYLSSEEKEILEIVAIAETNDILTIDNVGLVQEIAEEYANVGIRIIKEKLIDEPGDPLWNLVSLIG